MRRGDRLVAAIIIRPATASELEVIESTRLAYRQMWATLREVPHRAFDGGREDINALDFIDYEAGHHPHGLAGAALIWGGVLASTGALQWAVGDNQHLVLVSSEVYPRAMIVPYARVAEIDHSSSPQYGKYDWLLEETVLRLYGLDFPPETHEKLKALLSPDAEGFLSHALGAIEWLWPTRPKPKQK